MANGRRVMQETTRVLLRVLRGETLAASSSSRILKEASMPRFFNTGNSSRAPFHENTCLHMDNNEPCRVIYFQGAIAKANVSLETYRNPSTRRSRYTRCLHSSTTCFPHRLSSSFCTPSLAPLNSSLLVRSRLQTLTRRSSRRCWMSITQTLANTKSTDLSYSSACAS